jgi:hypothetical protein
MDVSCISLISAIAAGTGAIATAVMAYVTWKTLGQNKNQLSELKRQWAEQNRPKIVPSLVKSDGSVYLRIKNYSGVFANDVKVIISLDSTTDIDWYTHLKENLDKAILNIEPLGNKDMLLVFTDWHETIYSGFLNVDIEINGKINDTYKLNMSELNVINSDMSDILIKAIKDITSQLRRGIKMH